MSEQHALRKISVQGWQGKENFLVPNAKNKGDERRGNGAEKRRGTRRRTRRREEIGK
jgi:hypothetical protein